MDEKELLNQNEENNIKENIMSINKVNEKYEIINDVEINVLNEKDNELKDSSLVKKLLELQKNIKEDISLKTICN
jgi:hypothetical protein